MNQSSVDVHFVFASSFKTALTKGVAYVLSKRLAEGHICVDTNRYNKDKEQQEENPFWKKGIEVKDVQNFTEEVGRNKPLIVHGDLIYLNKYYGFESLLLERIEAFKQNDSVKIDVEKVQRGIETLFEKTNEVDWQVVATLVAVTNSFAILTGGPGTGKTTTVAKILAILFQDNLSLKVGLGAPTGKASARMNESLLEAKERLEISDEIKRKFESIQASTLHRMLGYVKGSVEFRYNEGNCLPYDVIIIDESSMIDVAMMSRLMKAVGSHTRLILLGDKNQLSSVEAGSVFGDLCQSLGNQMNCFSKEKVQFIKTISGQNVDEQTKESLLSDCVAELQVSHRFNGEVGIGRFSKSVIDGEIPDYSLCENKGAQKDLVIVGDDLEDDFFSELLLGYIAYIKEKDVAKALVFFNQVKVLCATKERERGVQALNLRIEQFLKKKKVLNPTKTYYENQPIMITKNNPLLGLFNGDIGLIRKNKEGDLKAYFDIEGAIKEIHLGYLTNAVTVFAMTIHKSQGSEFKDVIVCLPEEENMAILTRELLYTGVTRAKERALIIGSKEVLESTIGRRVERASGIQQRVMN